MSSPSANAQRTVLVVEDHEPLREFVRQVLEGSGYAVLAAGDATSARTLWDDRGDDIDLLITDVAMPGGSGIELCRDLLPRRPGLRALVMTGHGPEHHDPQCRALGAAHLQKPFSIGELVAEVRRALGEDAQDEPTALGS